MTPADLPNIRVAVDAAGVQTVVSFVLRWNPLVETIKALVADGAFGEPFFVQTDYWHNVVQSRYPGGGGYRRHHPMSAFLAGGCHAVDMARYLMGSDVVEVSAFSYDEEPDTPAPKTTVAILKFANGTVGKVSAGTAQWMPYVFNVDLFGPDGSIRGNKLYTRKLPGQTDLATIPTIPPDSGAVAHHPFQEEIRPLRGLHPQRCRVARQPGGCDQHSRGVLCCRAVERRSRPDHPPATAVVSVESRA